MLTRKPHKVRLGMTGTVTLRHHRVFGLQQDPVIFIHQDRPKRMIAVLAGESGDFNGCSKMLEIGVIQRVLLAIQDNPK